MGKSLPRGFESLLLRRREWLCGRARRRHSRAGRFGVNAWTAPNAGDRLIPEHQEADENEDEAERDEELYLVVQGRAVFELDGERHDARAGTFVFVRPRINRTAFAEEPRTVLVAVGGTPLDHLRTAIELSEMFRDYARSDSDLDAIRGEPVFDEIVAG